MNLVPPKAWLSAFRWQLPRRASGPDFADMGTAFGLDASLEAEPGPPPAQEKRRPGLGAPSGQRWLAGLRRAG